MQWDGKWEGCQPYRYRRHRASRKAPLWRANPCSVMGRVASQLDASFSVDASIALFMLLGSLSFNSVAVVASRCLRSFTACSFALSCSAFASCGYVWDCCRIRETRGAVICSDDWCWIWLLWDGLMMPSPPCRTGKAISSLVSSFSAFCPVRDGRNLCLIASSSG